LISAIAYKEGSDSERFVVGGRPSRIFQLLRFSSHQ